MADKTNKWEDNASGKYYIDKECILCALCHELAPNNIKESEQGDHNVVFKQPAGDEEAAQLKEAADNCPIEAIGDDGE